MHDECRGGLGLVLGGGAARGAFQAGVVAALGLAGVRFKAIAGTSVGAVNGAALLHGYTTELLDMWRQHLRDTTWFDRSLLLKGRSPFCISEAMRHMVELHGDVRHLCAHETELLISTTIWGTRTNRLFSSHDEEAGWNDEERVLQFLASLTIPWVCTERIVIRGVRYCDGALSRNLPVEALLARGCRRIVIVDPSPNHSGRPASRTRLMARLVRPLERLPMEPARVAAGLVYAMVSGPPALDGVDAEITRVHPPRELLALKPLDFLRVEAIDRALEIGLRQGERLADHLRQRGPHAERPATMRLSA
jgi:predicted acylesterase/phospholipase RssA